MEGMAALLLFELQKTLQKGVDKERAAWYYT
jgi:hypothetical protein